MSSCNSTGVHEDCSWDESSTSGGSSKSTSILSSSNADRDSHGVLDGLNSFREAGSSRMSLLSRRNSLLLPEVSLSLFVTDVNKIGSLNEFDKLEDPKAAENLSHSQPKRKHSRAFRSLNLIKSFNHSLGAGSSRITKTFGISQNLQSKTLNKSGDLRTLVLSSSGYSRDSRKVQTRCLSLRFRDFEAWYTSLLKALNAKQDTYKKFTTSEKKNFISSHDLFISGVDCQDPLDSYMSSIALYKTFRDTQKPHHIPSLAATEFSSVLANEVRSLYKPIEDFCNGPYPGTKYTISSESGTVCFEFLAGTKNSLIDGLIFPLDGDEDYIRAFFMSYRFFTSSRYVLESLIAWFNVQMENNIPSNSSPLKLFLDSTRVEIRKRVLKCIEIWVSTYWSDFCDTEDPNGVYALLMCFIDYLVSNREFFSGKLVNTVREQTLIWFGMGFIPLPLNLAVKPTEDHVAALVLKSLSIDDFVQKCYAVNMSYINLIPPSAYVEFILEPYILDGSTHHPYLTLLMDYFSWIRDLGVFIMNLVPLDNTKKAKKRIKKCINMANSFRKFGDYSSLSAALWALKSPAITQMKSVWMNLGRNYKRKLLFLDIIMSSDSQYNRYWKEVDAKRVAIPYIVPHMLKALLIKENASLYLKDGIFVPSEPITMQEFIKSSIIANPRLKSTALASLKCLNSTIISSKTQSEPPTPQNELATSQIGPLTIQNEPSIVQNEPSTVQNELPTPSSPASIGNKSLKEEDTDTKTEKSFNEKADILNPQFPLAGSEDSDKIFATSGSVNRKISTDSPNALLNFQKLVDIRNVIVDMIMIMRGKHALDILSDSSLGNSINQYNKVFSEPFMKYIFEVVKGVNVNSYFNVPITQE